MTYASSLLAHTPSRHFKLADLSGIVAVDSSAAAVAAAYLPNNGSAWNGGTLNNSGAHGDYPAALLNGTSGYVNIPSQFPPNGATAFTLIFSVYPTAGSDYKVLFSRFVDNSTRVEVHLGKTGEFGADLGLVCAVGGGAGRTLGDVLTLNAWNHVAIRYDGALGGADRLQLVVGGEAKSFTNDQVPASVPTISATSAQVGSRQGSALFFEGGMQDVAIYPTALTVSQIQALHTELTSGTPAPPPPAPSPPAGPYVLTAAAVPAHGGAIDLTFDSTASPAASLATVLVGGVYVPVTGISGSGTAWTLAIGKRYVRAGQAVSVTYDGTTVSATNGSETNDTQVKHLSRQFGMFIHFGIETFDTANPLSPEWSLPSVSSNVFAPTGNIAAAVQSWVDYAVAAGMRYIVLTAKHHYGFCLWPTATGRSVDDTTWWAANGNPDIIDLFTTKCRAAGLGVGLYFSVLDRSFQADTPGFTNSQYEAHTAAQLTELMTQYGTVDMVWFDGYAWAIGSPVAPPGYGTFSYAALRAMVKDHQPACSVLVNNHEGTRANTDMLSFELPANAVIPESNLVPAEACTTVSAADTWFHHEGSLAVKTAASLIALRNTANSRRTALLLNVPPVRTGFFGDPAQRLLAEMGAAELEYRGESRNGIAEAGPAYGPGFGGNFIGL